MQWKLISALLAGAAIFAASGVACAQHGQFAPPKMTMTAHSAAVPFELFRGNRVMVNAIINGHPTPVLLDTGASTTTIDRAYARSIGIPEGQKIVGRGAGGNVEAEIVPNISLEVGGVRFEDMTVGVMDLASISRGIGRPINVILGREFFNSTVLSFDWANNRLSVHAPEAFTPRPGSTLVGLGKAGPFNTIPVSISGDAPIDAVLDLGNGGSLLLPPTYWSGRSDLSTLKYADTMTGGVGGLHAARVTVVPTVTLAGKTFASVPSILSVEGNDHDPTRMANVGIGLLKQFDVDLDLGRDRIYLKPRTDAPGFERDRAGVRFDFAGDRLRVAYVSPQGPAAEAGLKPGDEVLAVDNRKVAADYYRAPDWTRGAAGRTVTLDRADGTRVAVKLADYF